MRLSKSAHYALQAALDLAMADEPLTVAMVAARHALPEGALAKVFQTLVHAGIAHGTRGVGGGYRLAVPAATISVLQLIELFDLPSPPRAPAAPGHDRLQELFREVEETTRATFASVSLETLARRS